MASLAVFWDENCWERKFISSRCHLSSLCLSRAAQLRFIFFRLHNDTVNVSAPWGNRHEHFDLLLNSLFSYLWGESFSEKKPTNTSSDDSEKFTAVKSPSVAHPIKSDSHCVNHPRNTDLKWFFFLSLHSLRCLQSFAFHSFFPPSWWLFLSLARLREEKRIPLPEWLRKTFSVDEKRKIMMQFTAAREGERKSNEGRGKSCRATNFFPFQWQQEAGNGKTPDKFLMFC